MANRNVADDASNANKATIVDNDAFLMRDSESNPNSLKEVLWSLIKSTIAAATMTLTNKTLTTPTIADFTNAIHTHIGAAGGGPIPMRDGDMVNGKLSVTVVSNDLVLALKTAAGTDPSSTDPVYIKINGTVRTVTAATSCTLADATNWFGSGGAMFAAKEIDYFAYAIWDSNSSVVAIAPARYPGGRLVSDFSSTNTHEKHLGNFANYTSTDDVTVIGRFAATLSAAAGHVWTVPTFTNVNLIQRPIFETRWLSFLPTYSATSPMTFGTVTTSLAIYQVRGLTQEIKADFNGTTGGTATNVITFTLPFSVNIPGGLAYGTAYVLDATASAGYWRVGFALPIGLAGIEVLKGDESVFGLGAGRYTRGSIVLPI
jgi:hypothetical protein